MMLSLAAQPWLEQEPTVLIFWKKALLITLGSYAEARRHAGKQD